MEVDEGKSGRRRRRVGWIGGGRMSMYGSGGVGGGVYEGGSE